MSALRVHERLDKLAADIDAFRVALLDHERASLDLVGDEHQLQQRNADASAVRALLHEALVEHFELSHRLIMSICPAHGNSVYLGCSACSRVARARLSKPEEKDLGQGSAPPSVAALGAAQLGTPSQGCQSKGPHGQSETIKINGRTRHLPPMT